MDTHLAVCSPSYLSLTRSNGRHTEIGSKVFQYAILSRLCGEHSVARREAVYQGPSMRRVLCEWGHERQV